MQGALGHIPPDRKNYITNRISKFNGKALEEELGATAGHVATDIARSLIPSLFGATILAGAGQSKKDEESR
jgi:hypothetical protein